MKENSGEKFGVRDFVPTILSSQLLERSLAN